MMQTDACPFMIRNHMRLGGEPTRASLAVGPPGAGTGTHLFALAAMSSCRRAASSVSLARISRS